LYETVYTFLNQPDYNDGMEPYTDFLRLLVALLKNGVVTPDDRDLAALAYYLNDEQRQLLGRLALAAERRDDAAIAAEIGEDQYQREKARRFGAHNPELMDVPFWRFMVQREWPAYQARLQFDPAYRQYMAEARARHERQQAGAAEDDVAALYFSYGPPVWCFKRFGMSLTRLPDGRALFIAGEHEDFYDYDFQIYNDVIVVDHALHVTIYGYPAELFPPTDFHSATLVDDTKVYLVGNLGYPEARKPGETQVYRLDTSSMQISAVATSGTKPGWISRHHAEYDTQRNAIKVSGGKVWTGDGYDDNQHAYRLDLATMTWSLHDPASDLAVPNG
ncbi:MAG TPA: hypothetical protein VFT99_08970, partial [Roseiflexaceae bacterium]|nr:hypothetical protein [Roseiflexaceae bacterium]